MGRLRELIPVGDSVIISPMPSITSNHESKLMKRYNEECSEVVSKPLVEWCVPCVTRTRGQTKPCCGIYKSGVSLNAAAVELLDRPSKILIGKLFSGELAVMPASDDDPRGYRVSYVKKGASVGRSSLAKQLIEKGLNGLYVLEHDAKLGLYVGRKVK